MSQINLLKNIRMIHEKYDQYSQIYSLEEDYCSPQSFISAIESTILPQFIKDRIIDEFNQLCNCDLELEQILKKYGVK